MTSDIPANPDRANAAKRAKQSVHDIELCEDEITERTVREIPLRIRERKRMAVGEQLLAKVRDFYQQQLSQARQDVAREMRSVLTLLVERYKAASGTVLMVDGNRCKSISSFFGIPLDESIPFDNQIFLDAQDASRFVSDALHDSPQDGHCEVFCLREPISQAPLGFVLLRWKVGSESMTEVDRLSCEADVLRMVVPVLCWKRNDPLLQQEATPWTPLVSGWTFKRFLTQLCELVSNTLAIEYSDSGYSASIWTVDWDAKQLWARATHGIDEEYLTEVDGQSLPWNSSLIQQIARADHLCYQMIDDPATSAFHRKDKIDRYRISKIVGMPIYRRSDKPNQASIVFVSYHFGDATTHPNPFPLPDVFQRLGSLLEGWIESYHLLRHEAAVGYARWKMEETRMESIIGQASVTVSRHHPRSALWHAFKDILVTCLKPDGCSIFLNRSKPKLESGVKAQRELVLVATTGVLDAEWDASGWNIVVPADASRLSYHSEVASHDKSLMMYLYRHPDKAPLRIRSLLEWQAHIHEFDLDLLPGENAPEMCTDLLDRISPETPDRRFLGTVLQHQDGGVCRGVVRLVRSLKSKPFTADDERLLERLCVFFMKGEYEFLSLPKVNVEEIKQEDRPREVHLPSQLALPTPMAAQLGFPDEDGC